MRATSTRRLIGGAAALTLIGATLLSSGSTVLAGETRDITIDTTGLTPVSAGGVTKTDITITNASGHTLTNAHFLIGLDQVKNLPGDVTVVSVFGGDSGVCPTVTTPVSTYDCAFGNISYKPNQKTRSLSVVFGVGASGPHSISVEVKVAETGSDVGSNVNYNTATLSTTASQGDCNHLATYKVPGDGTLVIPVIGGSCDTSDSQRSGLLVPANANGNVVSVQDAIAALDCGTLTCLGFEVVGNVNSGAPVTPYLTWSIFYSNSILGNLNPNKVAFFHGTTLIPAGNKGLCKTASSVDCQDPYHVGDGGVTFYIRTQTNGGVKGAT
jgi:hypothetical protein